MTKNCKEILNLIYTSDDHMTAEGIFQKVTASGMKMSLATVYNSLNSLYADGHIRKLSFQNQNDRYDKAVPHDHLICRKCGKIKDFNFRDLIPDLSKKTGTSVLAYDLNVYFLCENCSGKEE